MAGTEEQWSKKLLDITKRGHEIIDQGIAERKGYYSIGSSDARSYWARVKIPE